MNVLIVIGVLLYVISQIVDRFIHPIPSKVAVPVYAVGAICLIAGIIRAR